jgi:hypothetical protein
MSTMILDGATGARAYHPTGRLKIDAAIAESMRDMDQHQLAVMDGVIGYADAQVGRLDSILRGAANLEPGLRSVVSDVIADPRRMDAAGIALGEELIKISTRNVEFAEKALKSAELIDMVMDPPSMGHEQYAWQYMTGSGYAVVTNTLSTPTADASVTREGRNTVPLTFILSGWEYSDLDLARAALSNVNLSERKMQRSLRAIASTADQIFFVGNTPNALPGLLTQSAIVGVNFQNTGGALNGLSAVNLLAYWKARFDAYLAAVDLNKDVSWRWRCMTNGSNHRLVATTPLGTGYQTTVLAQLELEYSKFGFAGWDTENSCTTAGTGSSSMSCIYPDRSYEYAPKRVQVPGLMMAQPDRRFWTTEHAAAMKIGGTILESPKAVHYAYDLGF